MYRPRSLFSSTSFSNANVREPIENKVFLYYHYIRLNLLTVGNKTVVNTLFPMTKVCFSGVYVTVERIDRCACKVPETVLLET